MARRSPPRKVTYFEPVAPASRPQHHYSNPRSRSAAVSAARCPHPRGKPGFSTFVRACGRETDCPLEEDVFEPSVPRRTGRSIRVGSSGVPSGARVNREICRRCGGTRPATLPES
jgi:hypothetical protein